MYYTGTDCQLPTLMLLVIVYFQLLFYRLTYGTPRMKERESVWFWNQKQLLLTAEKM